MIASCRGRGIGPQLLREVARRMMDLDRPSLSILLVTSSGWVIAAGFRHDTNGTFVGDAAQIAAGG